MNLLYKEPHNEEIWMNRLLGLAHKRNGISNKDFVESRESRGNKEEDPHFWGMRGKRTNIRPNGLFHAFRNPLDARNIEILENFDKKTMKPNSIFGTISTGKRNANFASLNRRLWKPNSIFPTFSRRSFPGTSRTPYSVLSQDDKRKRTLMRPNGLFFLSKKRLIPLETNNDDLLQDFNYHDHDQDVDDYPLLLDNERNFGNKYKVHFFKNKNDLESGYGWISRLAKTLS